MRSGAGEGTNHGRTPAAPAIARTAAALDEGLAPYHHEVRFYAGIEGFTALTAAFVRDGLQAGEAILVVATADKVAALRDELGADARDVALADMAVVGRNPARIIPAWADFLAARGGAGRRVRGVGEPIFAARTLDELTECQRHEALLNRAFADRPGFWLMCPYDTTSLAPEVLEVARHTHPGEGYDPDLDVFAGELPEPHGSAAEFAFDVRSLEAVRHLVASVAHTVPLGDDASADLLLAVDELATNSIRHGGGRGTVRVWVDGETVVCEVRDSGRITDPMIGRWLPPASREGGRGVWIANQLCDLVQIRSGETGTVVRVRRSPPE